MKNIKFLILTILFIFIPSLTFGANYYAVSSASTTEIDEHGICKEVSVTNSIIYFVPTRTQHEWTSFIYHKPSSVSLAECEKPAPAPTTTTTPTTTPAPVAVKTGSWYKFESGPLIIKTHEKCSSKGRCTRTYSASVESVHENCAELCSSKGLSTSADSKGNSCASGESRPEGWQGGSDKYPYGKWGNTSKYDSVNATPTYIETRSGTLNVCYKPGQRKDLNETDLVVACYCK